ncbi:hypothetical protein [uncultured Cohaesibacter sp.]|uniref:hypothetical protein n=1 Tax=uncultured Cohaesibacter sp. TaxID=1002546 RepID=UPI0029C88BD7|nr:hypothetical protein [uncultured Cohaesibacter sp.]
MSTELVDVCTEFVDRLLQIALLITFQFVEIEIGEPVGDPCGKVWSRGLKGQLDRMLLGIMGNAEGFADIVRHLSGGFADKQICPEKRQRPVEPGPAGKIGIGREIEFVGNVECGRCAWGKSSRSASPSSTGDVASATTAVSRMRYCSCWLSSRTRAVAS